MELRLSVEDPQQRRRGRDAIRCCKLAQDRGIGGPILPVCAYTMKHPPIQMSDQVARAGIEQFINQVVPQEMERSLA